MENGEAYNGAAMQDYRSFLAMLGDESFPAVNSGAHLPAEVQTQNLKFDDEMRRVAMARSPEDGGSPVQDPALPDLDLDMINDVIRQNEGMQEEGMQEDMMTNPQQVSPDFHFQQSSPHLYDNFHLTALANDEEVPQAVPVQNPSVMISGAMPHQLITTDPSQLQDTLVSQTMTIDPSESMSGDQLDAVDDMADDDDDESIPADGSTDQAEGEGNMDVEAKTEEIPTLPNFEELLIRIRYRSQEVERKHIKNNNGCLAFYSKPWAFQQPRDLWPDPVQFPDITPSQRAEMTDSQFMFTEQVLKALEKGLFLRCDRHGNVFATRFCRSKIFWYSTEKGPIAEAQIKHRVPNLTFQKLERNTEVIVFDNMLFQQKLLHYVVNKPTFKSEAARANPNKHTIPISPAIFFTFAQSWNPLNSALSSCLVSMVVNPVRARMQRQWGNEDRHESYDLSNYRLQMSSVEPGEKS